MLSVALALLIHALTVSLRLSGQQGSFLRPLSPQEERDALARYAAGDMSARNQLIEHNMRLVAHVIKNSCYKMIAFSGHTRSVHFRPF